MSGFLEPLKEDKRKHTRSVTRKYEEDDFFKPQTPIPPNMAAVSNSLRCPSASVELQLISRFCF